MTESEFQSQVIHWLKSKGCVVMKIPAGYAGVPVGFPDLLALVPGGGFLALECKKNAKSKFQPLQKQWIKKLDDMYYSRAIYPEIWDDTKKELMSII